MIDGNSTTADTAEQNESTRTIDITPNFSNMHAGYLRDAEQYARDLGKHVNTERFHKWLGALTIATASITTPKELVAIQEHLHNVLTVFGEKSTKKSQVVEETDIIIRVKPETRRMQPLVSIEGDTGMPICIDLTRAAALEKIEETIDDLIEMAGSEDVCTQCGGDFDHKPMEDVARTCPDCGHVEDL